MQNFEEELRSFSDSELRWDYHCVIHRRAKVLIEAEARRRGISLHGFKERRGGPFVTGMKWFGECDCRGGA